MNLPTDPDLDLTLAASRFAALGSEQRLLVLRTLVRVGNAGLSIGDLGDRCGITGSTLTHHIKTLTTAGLVRQTRAGRQIICAAVAYDTVEQLSQFLLQHCCADAETPSEDHTHG